MHESIRAHSQHDHHHVHFTNGVGPSAQTQGLTVRGSHRGPFVDYITWQGVKVQPCKCVLVPRLDKGGALAKYGIVEYSVTLVEHIGREWWGKRGGGWWGATHTLPHHTSRPVVAPTLWCLPVRTGGWGPEGAKGYFETRLHRFNVRAGEMESNRHDPWDCESSHVIAVTATTARTASDCVLRHGGGGGERSRE